MPRTGKIFNQSGTAVEPPPPEYGEQPSADGRKGENPMVSALLVEDNITFRQTFKEILYERFPFLVVGEAATGKDALRKVEAWRPKLIFMDIKLPGENGLEITKKIKKEHPGAIVIVLTSYDLPEYRHAAKVFGANYFLCKDASSEEILSLVGNILAHPDNVSEEEG